MPARQPQVKLSIGDTFALLWPYFVDNLSEQIRSIWFIIAYLAVFQVWLLGLPVSYAGMIGLGILIVTLGLMFFMEGLRLGLMPLAETIGAILPRNSAMPAIVALTFLFGFAAAYAEPALAALRQAGSSLVPYDSPLVYSLLTDFPGQLVFAVAVGVGCAVLLGVVRFFYGWRLKILLLPGVGLLLVATVFAASNPVTSPLIGLAWDCGGITTGPVTVPLVLALGIGVCRIVGDGDSAHAGFGIVTLASLTPVIAVLTLGLGHYVADDYYGRPDYRGELVSPAPPAPAQDTTPSLRPPALAPYSPEEFNRFLATGAVDEGFRIRFEGGERALVDGRIVLRGSDIVLEKEPAAGARLIAPQVWNPAENFWSRAGEALVAALRAVLPLCLFLYLSMKLLLREPLRNGDEVAIGVAFAAVGMTLFALGMNLGLSPLGGQLGSNVPRLFTSVSEAGAATVPLFANALVGKLVAVSFGFFLGYGATLAEPALRALGNAVEKTTVGAFPRSLLIQTVALGVGVGTAGGLAMMVFNVPLALILVPAYLAALLLTLGASEEFIALGWDSAGVTTGPVSVPLMLATGLAIGSRVPGVADGFGILALASLGPILSMLLVGHIVNRTHPERSAARAATR